MLPLLLRPEAVPADSTGPLTYTWRASGQPAAITHSGRGSRDSVDLIWPAEGTYVINVTALSDCGFVTSNTLTIRIATSQPTCIAIEKLAIEAPGSCQVGTPCPLKAIATPATANTSITCTWSTSGQPPLIVHTSKVTTDSAAFTWTDSGPQTVTVVATDECRGVVNAMRSVDVRATPPPCSPLTEVSISGPPSGTVGTPCRITASAKPEAATTPISYTWRSTGQSGLLEHAGQGATDVAELVWKEPGTYMVTVLADNACAVVVTLGR